MPATPRRSTQPALWPLCPPALHIADPRPANRNFKCSHPLGGRSPLSRKPSRRLRGLLSPLPRPHTVSPPPNLARSSSPSGTTRRNSCDGAPQLAQGAALRFVGYRESGLIVPRHPANPREVAGLAVGLHSESPGIGAEPARVPEPVGTSLREAGHIFGGCRHNTVCLPEVCEIGGLGIQVFRRAQLPSVAGFGNVR